MSKWYITKLVLLWFLGTSLNEVSSFIYSIYPNSADIFPKHMYLSKSYEQPKISVLYFFYEIAVYLDRFIKSVVVFKIASFVSVKLRKVCFWFVIMYGVQIYYYLYDRDTVFRANIILYCIILLICSIIIWPDKKFYGLKVIKPN